MKVLTEELSQNVTVDAKSSKTPICYEKKNSNESGVDEQKVKCDVMNKGEVTKRLNGAELEAEGSSSDDESNVEPENRCKTNGEKNGQPADRDAVDDLTTQVIRMKLSNGQKKDSAQNVADQLSILSVNDTDDRDGRKSPQLLSRGPDGGKVTSFNHINYGHQDWAATQANVRMKAMAGKRGYEDEINPYKYSRSTEPVENGDYTEAPYPNSMSDAMAQPQMVYGMTQQPMQRPIAQAYRMDLNNLSQPQTSSYQDMMLSSASRNVMSGGLVNQVWDPDSLLALLDDPKADFSQPGLPDNNFLGHEMGGFQQQQLQTDKQIMNPQMIGLEKTKRNLSGDESGYDSDLSRMSTSTSPFSPESALSPKSVPSPQPVGRTQTVPYTSQMPKSPMSSNIGSPYSVDSGVASDMSPAGSYMSDMSPAGSHMSAMSPAGSHMSAMSPAGSHMSAMSPAGSHMSAMSPGTTHSVDSPMPSPGSNLNLPCGDGLTPDSILSDLTNPIPHSPSDKSAGQYIDENLGALKDLYDVIAKDLKNQQHKRTDRSTGSASMQQVNMPDVHVGNNVAPKPMTSTAPVNVAKVPVADVSNLAKPAPEAPKTGVPGLPVSSSTMTPVILKPLNTGAPMLPQQTQVLQMGQVGQVGPQNIVWVPFNPAPPIIVVRQTTPSGQKKGGPSKPRPILPKMPTILPSSSKTSTSATSSSARVMTTSSPVSKPQVVASSSPAVVSALTSQPGVRPTGKVVPPSGPMAAANRPMAASQLQHQQQLQSQQAMVGMPQGQMRPPGMMLPQNMNPALDGCGPNKLNLARRYIAEMKKQDLHFQDQDGDTYLHVAICRTDPYLVKAILERLVRENLIKELIDKPNKKRQTPLYVAVADNQPLMVRELVQCGAEPDCLAECQWNNGMRKEVKAAIHCAAQGGHTFTATLAELLKAKGINLNLANSEGLTAVHCAIQEHGKVRGSQVINSIPTVEMLIRAGADPNVQDKKSGKTPLMYAIETKDYNLVLTMVNLIDKDKLRLMLKTQTFDGNNCSKICSGLRMDSDIVGWRKINSLILSVSNGSDPRLCDTMSMIST